VYGPRARLKIDFCRLSWQRRLGVGDQCRERGFPIRRAAGRDLRRGNRLWPSFITGDRPISSHLKSHNKRDFRHLSSAARSSRSSCTAALVGGVFGRERTRRAFAGQALSPAALPAYFEAPNLGARRDCRAVPCAPDGDIGKSFHLRRRAGRRLTQITFGNICSNSFSQRGTDGVSQDVS